MHEGRAGLIIKADRAGASRRRFRLGCRRLLLLLLFLRLGLCRLLLLPRLLHTLAPWLVLVLLLLPLQIGLAHLLEVLLLLLHISPLLLLLLLLLLLRASLLLLLLLLRASLPLGRPLPGREVEVVVGRQVDQQRGRRWRALPAGRGRAADV